MFIINVSLDVFLSDDYSTFSFLFLQIVLFVLYILIKFNVHFFELVYSSAFQADYPYPLIVQIV